MSRSLRIIKPLAPPIADTCNVALAAGHPGVDEARTGQGFASRGGRLLRRMLRSTSVDPDACLMLYVIPIVPPAGMDTSFFFVKKADAKKSGWDKTCAWPAFGSAGYIKPEYEKYLSEFVDQVSSMSLNIAVALGPLALWALTGQSKIGSYRGAILPSTSIPGLKVLPTYEPEAVQKNWDFLPIVVMDIKKAARQSAFPEIKQKRRYIWTEPSIDDLWTFYDKYIKRMQGGKIPLSYDIETIPDNITCVSFAPNDSLSIMVPLMDTRKKDWNYWDTLDAETDALQWMDYILSDATIPKLAQNGVYDMIWLHMLYGISVRGTPEDTMIMAHALDPELPKGLGFLGSIYTDEPAWKNFVSFKKKAETDKEFE